MKQNSQLEMYSMVHQLVNNDDYDVIYINDQTGEIWLEKMDQRTSIIVRISIEGFDWMNHLKKDIAIVFQKTKSMRRLLRGKKVEIHNVYISPHTPVDSWEILKKPLRNQDKNPITMNMYYLSGDEYIPEQKRLMENLAVTFVRSNELIATIPTAVEQEINQFKLALYQNIEEKRKKRENLFTAGKPLITYILIAINAIIFLLLELNGGSQNNETLINYGAKYNPAIMDGEWWRLIISMFLHIGVIHFLLNMLFLYYFGSLAERMYGSIRFFIIYTLAGLFGGIVSFSVVTNLSAGASGALYGLFGAFLYFGIFHSHFFRHPIGKNILVVLGLNLALGFFIPQLDVSAHLGGIVGGFIASAIVHFSGKRKWSIQPAAFILYTGLIVCLFFYGIEKNESDANYQLMNSIMLLDEERYEEVIQNVTKGLEEPGELEAILLFQRSFAYIQLQQVEQAIRDLENCIDILEKPDDLPEAYTNLVLLYQDMGDPRAKEVIKEAYRIHPSNDKIKQLYQTIIGD